MLFKKLTLSIIFTLLFSILFPINTFSQCFQIESILVAACTQTGGTEGYNEMVRLRVGSAAVNTSSLTVNWPSNSWTGIIQNATTTAKVVALNADIVAAGGCALLLQPIGGVLPANAPVILVTSYLFDTTANSFSNLTEDTYIIFQDNPSATGGHFGNYNASGGTRSLSMSFGGTCSDNVTYTRNLLSQTFGATVNFTPSGAATYTNNGCLAPVAPFTVDAGVPEIEICPGETVNLNGIAQGQQSVKWTATSGIFANPSNLSTTYVVSNTAVGTFPLTLTATNNCGKEITDIINIKIKNATTPTFNAFAPICNGQSLTTLPTTSINGVNGTWAPALDNTSTTTYTFTPTAGQCATTTTLTITVNSGSTIPTFSAIAPICSGQSLTALPTTSTNGVNGIWSPALDNTDTTTYTFTPNTGQCATITTLTIIVNSASTTPTFNTVAPICNGQSLMALPTTSTNGINGTWSPALDNTATTTYTFTPNTGQCAATTTLTINVNTAGIIPTFNQIPGICIGGYIAPLPTISNNGITGTWSPDLINYTSRTYTFTPDNGQCATTTTLTSTVSQSTTPEFNAVAPICKGGNLGPLPTLSNNGIFGTWSPALDNTATTTYTFTPNSGQCASSVPMTITVNPVITPTFNAISPICPSTNLTALPTTSLNNIDGTWSPALDNTTTTTYTFTPAVGQCATTTTLTITVNSGSIPTFNPVAPICPNESLMALPSSSNNGITGTWSPAINNTATTTYTFKPDAGQCASTTTLTIEIKPFTNPILNEKYYLCTNVPNSSTILNCGLSNTEYSFVWKFNGAVLPTTINTHIATEIGNYEITATNKLSNCFASTETNVLSSSIATAYATVEEDFKDNQIITVNVTGGTGDYEFQLNNGLPQTSNQFYINEPGEYEIIVRDKNGCGAILLQVYAINYPHFFTPNSDGFNDYWNIKGLENQPLAEIFIFDRYGKLITLIKPSSLIGWNGKYNGSDLPSTDYWFVLSYINKAGENKEFKAHFSLKR